MLKKSKLALAIVLASASCFAFGQQANSNIEIITVTANKKEENLQHVLASVTVIDRAEIERSNARDLSTLLATQTGIQINRQGGQGQNATLFVRGLESKYTLLLVDGVRVGSATLGFKNISNIPLSSIERVEIVKGSRAAYYGSDALAGVINIITRNEVSDKVSLTLGSNSYQNVQVSKAQNHENVRLSLNAGYEKTDGIDVLENDSTNAADPDNDGYVNANLGANIYYTLSDDVAFKALAQYSKGSVEFDNYYDGQQSTIDETDYENYHAVIGAVLSGDKFSSTIDLAYSQDEDKTAASYGDSEFSTRRFQVDYIADYVVSDAYSLNGGINWYQDKVDSSAAYTVSSRDNIAAFMGAYYELEAITINGALRLDDNEQFGSK
jgi:vitamin B12 transporter